MLQRIGILIVLIAVVGNVYLDMGAWGAGGLLILFMYLIYLDNQVKLLRHELRVARHDGEIGDNHASHPAN